VAVQRRSDGLLVRLARANRTAVFLGALILVLAGLFLPGIIGAAVLGALAVVLVLVARQTWPVTPPRIRTVRLVVLAALVAVALAKALW